MVTDPPSAFYVTNSCLYTVSCYQGVGTMDVVHQAPQKDGDTQNQTWEDREHYGDQKVNEEGDEGPADEDHGGEDDDDHVRDKPR